MNSALSIGGMNGNNELSQPSQTASSRTSSAKGVVSPQAQKLKKAAAEFESMLLSSFWKSMKESFSDSEESSDAAHDTLDDWGIQAMTTAMGKAGGLGIGKMILKHLEPTIQDRTLKVHL